jgi:hypothetical protein
MKCPQCSQAIKWQEQHEYEDFNLQGEGVINVHFCTNIDCNVVKRNTKQSTLTKNIALSLNALKYG